MTGQDSYYYDECSCTLEDESAISIKDCVEDGVIRVISIPIVDELDAYDFLNAYEVLEDYDEALDRVVNVPIYIWAKGAEVEDCLDDPNMKIVESYTVDDLRSQFDHSSDVPVLPTIIEHKVISNEENIVLPYNVECIFQGDYSWEHADYCFVKGVLLSDLTLKIPYMADGVALKKAVFNITNPHMIPNLSRNNVSKLIRNQLEYAIGKAIHLWIRDNGNLQDVERKLLDLFIEKKYCQNNCFLKTLRSDINID